MSRRMCPTLGAHGVNTWVVREPNQRIRQIIPKSGNLLIVPQQGGHFSQMTRFLIFVARTRNPNIPISKKTVLYCAHLCMKSSLGISNFLEEISSLSHSIVFLYFFALIAEEGFLISPCYSLEICNQMLIPLLFSFYFSLLFFFQLFVRPPRATILPFCISFSWGWS